MLKEIPLEKLKSPKRDSRFVRDDYFEEFLAKDIEKETLLIPPLVRPLPNDFFEIVDGETRINALRAKGVKSAMCDVRELSDDAVLFIRIKLNMNRKKTDYIGISHDLKELKEKGFNVKELCERFGWKKAWIYRLLALNKLSFEQKLEVAEGRRSVLSAYSLLIEKRIPKNQKETKITCRCCQRETSQDTITYIKLCPRCVALLANAHQQKLKLERVSKRHKRLF